MDKSINFKLETSSRPNDKKYSDWDTLGFNAARETFLNIIDGVMPPLTLGLYGPWGSGKTEMIRALHEDLNGRDCLPLIFDAWKYRREENLVLPLICALEREYGSGVQEIKDSAKKVVTSAAVVMANQFLKHKTGIDIGDIKTTLEIYESGYKHYKKYDDSVAAIENEFKQFIEDLLSKTRKSKIVAFVDNLDRCLPDVVVNMLEDISSFLSICGVKCIYVLSMDRDNVIHAIKHRYPDFDGAHYLEKIVQVPLKMPVPQGRENHESSWGLYHILKRYEQAKMYKDVSKSGDGRDQIFKALITIDPVFRDGLLGNPRRAERFVNKVIALEIMRVLRLEGSSQNGPTIVFALLLQEYFRKIYDALKDDADYQCLINFIQMRAQKKETPPHKIRQQRDAREPNLVIQNEVIFNAYCDDVKFQDFLKDFSELSKVTNLQQSLKQICNSLNLIG